MIRICHPDLDNASRLGMEIELSISRIKSRFVPVLSRLCAKVIAPHT